MKRPKNVSKHYNKFKYVPIIFNDVNYFLDIFN